MSSEKTAQLKTIELEKLSRASLILKKINETIDPRAFIGGGFALAAYLGERWSTDIDIFFSSPNFDFNALGRSAFNQLRVVLGDSIKLTSSETYWYNKRFTRIANYLGCDLIQVNAPDKQTSLTDYVFEKFDINVCKISLRTSEENILLTPHAECLEGLKKKTLIYDLELADYSYESQAQAKVTKNRVEKYTQRFPDFKVEVKK